MIGILIEGVLDQWTDIIRPHELTDFEVRDFSIGGVGDPIRERSTLIAIAMENIIDENCNIDKDFWNKKIF